MSDLARVIRFPDRRAERLLTTAELIDAFADRGLAMSERWWRYRMAEPGFPKIPWGGRWRYRASDVEAFLERMAS